MIWQLHKTKRRQILIDIDTQRDFLLGSGRELFLESKYEALRGYLAFEYQVILIKARTSTLIIVGTQTVLVKH